MIVTLRQRTLAAVLFLFCAAHGALFGVAFEARLLRPDGVAAAGYSISVVGQPVAAFTDSEGLLKLDPAPPVPFILVATSPAGDTSAPFEVADPGVGEIELPEVLRESVTVVSGVAPSLDLLPGSVATVLTREELEQRAPQRLYQALESIAGASKVGDGADAVPVLRNLGRGRTLILIDGARVTAERRAGPSATFVDPASLASVEILRGPGSVVYGSDAFGGVLNAVTRDPELDRRHLHYGVEGAFDAADERSAFVGGSTPIGAGALLLEGHFRDAGDSAMGGGEQIDNSAYSSFGGALRYVAPVGTGRIRLGLSLDRVLDLGKAAIDSSAVRSYYPNEDSNRLTFSWLGSAGSWDAVEASAFLGTYDIVLERDRAPTPATSRRIDRAATDARDGSLRFVAGRSLAGGRWQSGIDLASRFDLSSITSLVRFGDDGTTVERSDSVVAIEEATQIDGGIFATWTRPLADRVSLGLGARGDRVESRNQGGYFGDRSADATAFSGNAALSIGPFAGWTTTAQAARGFRSPTLSDRYFQGPSGRGFVVGNPNLGPETSLQFDLGSRWVQERTAIGLFAYRYQLDDLIERYRVGDNFTFRNRGRATIEGVEVEVQTAFAELWSLEAGLAVSDGGTDGSAGDDGGAAIDDIAPPNGWLTLRRTWGRAFAFGRVSTFLAHDDPGPTEVERSGYSLLELGGGFRWNDRVELRLLVRNLTDKLYYASPDESADRATGRTLSLALSGRI